MADIGTLNPEQMLQQQQILRQQKMAEMLMQQGMQQPQGQMVSGRYVAPSIFQNIAGLANQYVGQRGIEKAQQAQLDLAKAIRQGDIAATADFMKTRQGTPAEMFAAQAGPMPDGGNIPIQQSRAAVAPNPQAAYANLAADPRASARLQNIGLNKMFVEPEAFTLSADQSRFINMPDGTTKEIAKGIPKPPAPTTDMQNFLFAKERGEIPQNMGFLGYQKYIKQLSKDTDTQDNMSMVNNNGMPVGRFDKTGRYISPQGRVFPASAVTEAQKEHDVTMDLTNKLNNLTKGDIKNAFGSVMDYTGSKVGQMVGRKDVVDAQNKINSIQIKNVLDNLSQLKGASSDKEMAQMIKDFPAYTADPEIMEKWTDRAAKTANRFLKRSEQRYGFDTEYAQEDRFTGNKEKNQPSTKLNNQDQEALNWANANPNDPRSAQIKSRLNK
jgi:hypothetical protein